MSEKEKEVPMCKHLTCEVENKWPKRVEAMHCGAGWNVWEWLLAEVRQHGEGGETWAPAKGQQVDVGVDGLWAAAALSC